MTVGRRLRVSVCRLAILVLLGLFPASLVYAQFDSLLLKPKPPGSTGAYVVEAPRKYTAPLWRAAHVYSLPEAIDTALANDLKLQSLALESQTTDVAGKINLLKTSPSIGYKGEVYYAPNTPHFGYDPAMSNGGDVAAQLTAEKLIYDGGRANIASQQNALDLAHLNKEIEIERADVIRAVTEAYVDVVRTSQEVVLDSATLEESIRTLDLVARLEAGGASSMSDLLASRSDVNRSTLQLAQSVSAAIVARYSFAIAMGRPADSLANAVSSLDSILAASEAIAPVADSVLSLDRALGKIDLDKANLDILAAHAEAKPTITLLGDAGVWSSMDNLFASAEDRQHFLGASINLNIVGPIFDAGVNDLLVEQKTAEAANVRVQNAIAARTVQTELARVRLNLRQLRSNLTLAREAIRLASESYDRTLEVFAGGRASFNDVLTARKQYIDSRRTVLQILSDISASQAELTRLNAH